MNDRGPDAGERHVSRGDRAPDAGSASAPTPPARWRAVLVSLAIAAVAAAGLLPASALAWLRRELPLLSQALSRIERLWGGHDGSHVVLFVIVGVLLGAVLRRPLGLAVVRGTLVLAVLAVGSEAVQFFVPGRMPLPTDVIDDLLGGLAGLGAVLVLRAAAGVIRRPP